MTPEETSHLQPVSSEKNLQTSALARPSSGGAETLRTILFLHSSYPSGPGRLDLGDTDTSTSTKPVPVLQTSRTLMTPG